VPTITGGDDGWGSAGAAKTINPFLTASFENISAVPNTASSDVKNLFLASTDDLDKVGAGTEPSAPADPFDPFSSTPSKPPPSKADQVDAATDLLGGGDFSASASAQDTAGEGRHDNDEEDEDIGFRVSIKAESAAKDESASGPVPFLPPPPKRPKSPPSRENPFDKESPPEEAFATFEVEEKKEVVPKPPEDGGKVEQRGMSKSLSSETSSSYDEEEVLEPLEPFRSVLCIDSFFYCCIIG
jgi:hypothetical protein